MDELDNTVIFFLSDNGADADTDGAWRRPRPRGIVGIVAVILVHRPRLGQRQ